MSLDPARLPFADSVPPDVRRAYAGAQLRFAVDEVERAVDRLAVRLTAEVQDRDPLVVTVLPDGFVFAGMLMRRLVLPLTLAWVEWRDGELLAAPRTVSPGERPVLLIVAASSEPQGEALRRWAQQAGAVEIHLVALVETPAAAADFAALRSEAATFMGVGCTFAGYGANLPGLYVVNQTEEGT